jgi:hypothetical protein
MQSDGISEGKGEIGGGGGLRTIRILLSPEYS